MAKTKTIVIADAGSLIHLDELNSLNLLADFGKVIIPETVWHEVQLHRPYALRHTEFAFIRQQASHFSSQVDALTPLYNLHAGEQEALHLCFEFSNYRIALQKTNPNRKLFLAVENESYQLLFKHILVKDVITIQQISYFVFNAETEEITLWQT